MITDPDEWAAWRDSDTARAIARADVIASGELDDLPEGERALALLEVAIAASSAPYVLSTDDTAASIHEFLAESLRRPPVPFAGLRERLMAEEMGR